MTSSIVQVVQKRGESCWILPLITSTEKWVLLGCLLGIIDW